VIGGRAVESVNLNARFLVDAVGKVIIGLDAAQSPERRAAARAANTLL
jgi:hypothetical protein